MTVVRDDDVRETIVPATVEFLYRNDPNFYLNKNCDARNIPLKKQFEKYFCGYYCNTCAESMSFPSNLYVLRQRAPIVGPDCSTRTATQLKRNGNYMIKVLRAAAEKKLLVFDKVKRIPGIKMLESKNVAEKVFRLIHTYVGHILTDLVTVVESILSSCRENFSYLLSCSDN